MTLMYILFFLFIHRSIHGPNNGSMFHPIRSAVAWSHLTKIPPNPSFGWLLCFKVHGHLNPF
jgi:hypothetical protein